MNFGALQIKNSTAYIDGKPTKNPTLIGLEILNCLNETPKNCNYNASITTLNQYLKANKLRKTPERTEILKIIHTIDGQFEVETVHNQMQERKFVVSLSTAYNTIKLFVKCGILKESKINRKAGTIYTKTVFELIN